MDRSTLSKTEHAAEIPAVALAGAVTVGAVMLSLGAWWGMLNVQRGLTPGGPVVSAVSQLPAGPELSGADYVAGRELFQAACAACHGPQGTGVANLGKDLVHGKFPLAMNDAGLAKIIIKGRDITDPMNTTKIPMPPRGGRADYTDENIRQVVVFIRGLQDPRRVPTELPAPVASASPAAALAAAAPADIKDPTASGYEASWVLEGRALFLSSCVACHGADAKGLPNLGKNLVVSKTVASLDDEKLVAFLKKGRPVSDPENTTKVDMPPKGGNPALDDEKLESIAVYLRELQARNKSAS